MTCLWMHRPDGWHTACGHVWPIPDLLRQPAVYCPWCAGLIERCE